MLSTYNGIIFPLPQLILKSHWRTQQQFLKGHEKFKTCLKAMSYHNIIKMLHDNIIRHACYKGTVNTFILTIIIDSYYARVNDPINIKIYFTFARKIQA